MNVGDANLFESRLNADDVTRFWDLWSAAFEAGKSDGEARVLAAETLKAEFRAERKAAKAAKRAEKAEKAQMVAVYFERQAKKRKAAEIDGWLLWGIACMFTVVILFKLGGN